MFIDPITLDLPLRQERNVIEPAKEHGAPLERTVN
jgi:hypothetical protein